MDMPVEQPMDMTMDGTMEGAMMEDAMVDHSGHGGTTGTGGHSQFFSTREAARFWFSGLSAVPQDEPGESMRGRGAGGGRAGGRLGRRGSEGWDRRCVDRQARLSAHRRPDEAETGAPSRQLGWQSRPPVFS